MSKRSPRPFTLADMMVLVAVVAVSIPLIQWVNFKADYPAGVSYTSTDATNWVNWFWIKGPSCVAVVLALGLIPLRWFGRRPSVSRVLRQPGAVACLAALFAIAAGLAITLAARFIREAWYDPGVSQVAGTNLLYWVTVIQPIPMTVLGAWAALWLGGRWSPEASWIDRLGRALGVFWVANYPLSFFAVLFNLWLPYKYN